jgi:hypothetical protein
MRECKEYEITIEKLMRVVHNYTDPIRIRVVMGDAWLTCNEANHMRDFLLTECYSYRDKEEQERLMKYYKDVPVWNLTVWADGYYSSERGRTMYMGIEAHCHYKDIREGWLAEKDATRKAKRAEYRKRRKLKAEEGE